MTILVCNILCAVCLWFLLCAIAINFYLAKRNGIQKEKKSVVETGSMLLFFVLMVAIVLFKLFAFEASASVRTVFAVIGTIVILFGTAVNIGGRLYLKGNWGNQIRIYKDHTLVTNGIYRYVRHPLYASTIAMIYGFSFLYVNPLVFLLNSVFFLPFMIYRAKQEDTLLSEAFGEQFEAYRKKTGMLIYTGRRK